MKNLFVLFTFFQLFLNSQTNNGWSVVEKNNVYTNCLFFAEKHYSERFNIDDFPEICACVLKNTIQTFKEEDYKSQIVIEVNKFQTQLTDEYINSLKEECRTDLLDMINNVEFITMGNETVYDGDTILIETIDFNLKVLALIMIGDKPIELKITNN